MMYKLGLEPPNGFSILVLGVYAGLDRVVQGVSAGLDRVVRGI